MFWLNFILILAPFLYLLGLLVRDGEIYPTTTWVPIGNFVIYLSYALFAFLILFTVIGELVAK